MNNSYVSAIKFVHCLETGRSPTDLNLPGPVEEHADSIIKGISNVLGTLHEFREGIYSDQIPLISANDSGFIALVRDSLDILSYLVDIGNFPISDHSFVYHSKMITLGLLMDRAVGDLRADLSRAGGFQATSYVHQYKEHTSNYVGRRGSSKEKSKLESEKNFLRNFTLDRRSKVKEKRFKGSEKFSLL